jgi:hypothetical protein
VVANEDGPAAAAEIRKRAGDKNFVQVLLLSRNVEPLGQRRYWPIYEAAEEAGLPIGIHAFGFGGNPITASGWPSYYIEEMVGHSQCQQTALASMVLEGVFERHPKLKMVMIEAGFGWAPSLSWRLDKSWQRMRSEVPHLKRPPSEYDPRSYLLDHAADGRPRAARSSVRRDRLGRLGQIAVRDRLSALGFRRAVAGAAGRRQRRQPRGVLSRTMRGSCTVW